jgi:hypothetical protein
MTRDLDAELRARLRRVALPPAPVGLRERTRAVPAEASGRPGQRMLGNRGRMLMPLAAVLAIAAVAVSGGGSQRPPLDPTASIGSSTGPAGPGIAALSIQSTVNEWCSPGGCDFHVDLQGPGGSWRGVLDSAELGAPRGISPRLPAELAAGAYTLRAEIHVFGDAVYPGETGPRDLGTTATCSAAFEVLPDTRAVDATMSFWLDRCSVGAVQAVDAASLAAFGVLPTIGGDCGEFGCEYRVLLSGGGGSWQTVIRTPKPADQLAAGVGLPPALPRGTYVLEASAHLMSEEPFPGVGHQHETGVAGACSGEFVVAEDTGRVVTSITYDAESCSVDVESSTRVAEASQPPFEPSPIESPAGSPQVTCEPNPTDLPGLDCETAIDAALASAGDQRPIEKLRFFHSCWTTDGSLAECAIQAMGIVEITFADAAQVERYGVSGLPWTGVAAVLLTPAGKTERESREQWFGPDYPTAAPSGMSLPIWSVELSDDRRTLTVEFTGGPGYSWANPCSGDDYVPWVARSAEELIVRITVVLMPHATFPPTADGIPMACTLVGYAHVYHLELPEPFRGSAVPDLNGGVFSLE